MPVINPNDCVKFQQAIQQLGIPDEKVLASPICINADVAEALGDLPQWIYAVASSLSIDPTDPSVPPYTDILTAQGNEAMIGDPWILVGFGQAMTLAKFLNAVGPDNLSARRDHRADEGLRGSADPRLAGARLRQVPRCSWRVQRLHAVLQVQRRRRMGSWPADSSDRPKDGCPSHCPHRS